MTESNQPPDQQVAVPVRETQRSQQQQLQQRAAAAIQAAGIKKNLLLKAPARRTHWKLPLLSTQKVTVLPQLSAAAARISGPFWWVVVLPTLISILYFGFIASPVYISESSFVVRSAQTKSTSAGGLGALLQGSGFSSSSQDESYTVESYIQSMDAMKALDAQVDLKKEFGRKDIDFVKRFGGPLSGLSDEHLLRYYKRWIVSTQMDSNSSIDTLTVRAFSADDAFNINEHLLNLGEALVNKLNQQARHDTVDFAERDADLAETRAKQARLALSSYRNTKNILDPERQGALQLEETSKLQAELLSAKVQLAQLLEVAPANPQVDSLKNRIKTVEAAVSAQNLDIAGGNGSLAHKAEQYDPLMVELEFADKQLAADQALLAQAKSDALNKQLYLERIVQPNRPSIAWEPRRFRDIAATLLLSLVVWLITTLLITGVREHSD